MFFKICALKNFSNFTGKCRCFHKCFPLKFAKFWRFFYRTSSVVASVNCFWDICLSFQALRFPKFPKFLMRNMFWRSDWREEGQNTQFVIRYLSVFGRIRSLRTIFGNIHIQFEYRKIMNKNLRIWCVFTQKIFMKKTWSWKGTAIQLYPRKFCGFCIFSWIPRRFGIVKNFARIPKT